MPQFHYSFDSQADLNAALQQFHDAGVDPAFDADFEELERQFAELRIQSISEYLADFSGRRP
jgi:putative IMPACT (imprinted ancient) family translation regulator